MDGSIPSPLRGWEWAVWACSAVGQPTRIARCVLNMSHAVNIRRPVSGHVFRVERKRGRVWYAKGTACRTAARCRGTGAAWDGARSPAGGLLHEGSAKRGSTTCPTVTTGAILATGAASPPNKVDCGSPCICRRSRKPTVRAMRFANLSRSRTFRRLPAWPRGSSHPCAIAKPTTFSSRHGCPEHMTWPAASAEWWRAEDRRQPQAGQRNRSGT